MNRENSNNNVEERNRNTSTNANSQFFFKKQSLYMFDSRFQQLCVYSYVINDMEHISFYKVLDKVDSIEGFDRIVNVVGEGGWFSPVDSRIQYKINDDKNNLQIIDFGYLRVPNKVYMNNKFEKPMEDGKIKKVSVFKVTMYNTKTEDISDELSELFKKSGFVTSARKAQVKPPKENSKKEAEVKDVGPSTSQDGMAADDDELTYDNVENKMFISLSSKISEVSYCKSIKSITFAEMWNKHFDGLEYDVIENNNYNVKNKVKPQELEGYLIYGFEIGSKKLETIVEPTGPILVFEDKKIGFVIFLK